MTAERQTEGMCGRRLWLEMPVEKARQPWKQGDTAESCVGGGAITIAFLPPTGQHQQLNRERLAHQTPDTLN